MNLNWCQNWVLITKGAKNVVHNKVNTYSCHGVDAVYVVIRPTGSKLVGVLLFLGEEHQRESYNIVYNSI